jgi:hypothetical protein
VSDIAVSIAGSSSIAASVGASGGSISVTASGGQFSSNSTTPTVQQVQTFSVAPEKPPGMIYLSTRLDSGVFSVSVRSSTGYVQVLWWDGVSSGYGSGNSSSYITASRTIPTTSAYIKSSPKSAYIWATTNAGAGLQSGDITGLSCASKKITALSVSDCSLMTTLSCESNLMEFLDVSRCTSLSSLSCYGNRLRDLDVSTCTALLYIYCQSNLLTYLDVKKSPLLRTLQCNDNTIASLDMAASTSLIELFCYNNLLSSLAILTSPSLTSLNCSGNQLTSLRAVGVSLASPYGANIESNSLSSTALDRFYADLGLAGTAGAPVFAAGNPGVSSDTPSIATGKGYTVYGS